MSKLRRPARQACRARATTTSPIIRASRRKKKKRSGRLESSSDCSADESDRRVGIAAAFRPSYNDARRGDTLSRREKLLKLMQSYKLSFKVGDKTKALLFLQRAKELKSSVTMTQRQYIDVLAFAFLDEADVWYRAHKRMFKGFSNFEQAFKNMYIGACDEDDLLD